MSKETKAALIGAAAAIIVAFIGGIFLLLNSAYNRSTPPTLTPDKGTPPPRVEGSVTPSGDNSTPAPSLTSTTPTTALKTLTVNRQLVCTSNCESVATLQVTVLSFTFDTAQGQTSMHLSLNAQRNYADCYFTGYGSSLPWGALQFQDLTGKTYKPGGQLVNSYNTFSVMQEQSLTLTAIYSFLPSPGSTYTLLTTGFFCKGMSSVPTYGTIQFTF